MRKRKKSPPTRNAQVLASLCNPTRGDRVFVKFIYGIKCLLASFPTLFWVAQIRFIICSIWKNPQKINKYLHIAKKYI